MSLSILDVSNLSVRYGGTSVLEDIVFNVSKGNFLGLVGPNGSGKTTLVKCILGLVPPSKGTIRLFNQELSAFNQWHRIGYLPQVTGNNHRGFPATVREIIASGRLSLKRFPKRLTADDYIAVPRLIDLIDIQAIAHRKIDRLSGGQRQRVFLARAMVANPEVLFLDEPTAALDPSVRESFYKLLKDINITQKRTVIMVTHDIGTIGDYATNLLYIDPKIVFFGNFADFCRSSKMTVYFGKHSQHLICRQHEKGECP